MWAKYDDCHWIRDLDTRDIAHTETPAYYII